jgi:limonene-1,2-epoxide hydrolase
MLRARLHERAARASGPPLLRLRAGGAELGGDVRGAADFQVEVLRTAVAGDSVWVEWRWTGTRADSSRLEACGACIFGVRGDRIAWGRLYMEEIEVGGGIEAAVAELSVGKHEIE